MFTRQWIVALEGGDPDLKRITVAVSLNVAAPDYQLTVEASTLRYSGG